MPKYYVASEKIRFIIEAENEVEAAQKCFDYYERDIDLFAPMLLIHEQGFQSMTGLGNEVDMLYLNQLKGAEHVNLEAMFDARDDDDDFDDEDLYI